MVETEWTQVSYDGNILQYSNFEKKIDKCLQKDVKR